MRFSTRVSAQPAEELGQEAATGAMLAWQVTGPGDPPDSLSLNEIGVPSAGPGEVVVEVWSAGLGAADLRASRRPPSGSTKRSGRPSARPSPKPSTSPSTTSQVTPLTPGLELCGEIVAVGEGVSRARLGERVIGLTREPHGSLARFALARARDVLAAPSRLDDAEASVFHVAYQTGWMGLYRRAAVRVGDALVVHDAAGALGSAAVQLGRAAGAKVIAVVGSAEQAALARRLGAEVTADRSAGDVVEEVRKATDGAGADVVYDPVGGQAFEESLRMAGFEARIVLVGPPGAVSAPGNVSLFGLDWRTYLDARPEIVVRAHADLSSLAEVGALRPPMAGKLEFQDAPAGLAALAAGTGIGRLAVRPPR